MSSVLILHRAIDVEGGSFPSIRWDNPIAAQKDSTRVRGEWTPTSKVIPSAPGALDVEQARALLRILLPIATDVLVAFWAERGTNAYSSLTAPFRRDGFNIDPSCRSIERLDDGRYAVIHQNADWVRLLSDINVEFSGFPHDIEWPSRLWAADRTWSVRSPWDAHYTLVEAPRLTLQDLVANPVLETIELS